MIKKIARAHTNIALIKYWGKADAKQRLPLMSSLSMTLDAFYTDTYLEAATENTFYLNGIKQANRASERVFALLALLNERYGKSTHYQVRSYNTVPTAAGLASSSSAFAALVGAFDHYYQLELSPRTLSRLARMGSGSATRSIFGGFAIWQKGHDDASSYAYPLDEQPELDLHLLAIELNTAPKAISSTAGMALAQSSPLFAGWLTRNELELTEMTQAIASKDFTQLGQLAELNANEMHAMNLTAQPGFTYFEPATITLMQLVRQWRIEGIEVYYTLDAGPNIKLLCQLKNVKIITERLASVFDNVKIINTSFGPGLSYRNVSCR